MHTVQEAPRPLPVVHAQNTAMSVQLGDMDVVGAERKALAARSRALAILVEVLYRSGRIVALS